MKSYPSTDEELLAYQRVRLPRRATFTSILGSSGGRLVPYQLSMENEKRVRAELQRASLQESDTSLPGPSCWSVSRS